MPDEIKRSVNVAVDGKAVQFSPGPVPEGTSEETIARLTRAGAFGERPMASQGGAGTLEMSGVNPITSTATADHVLGNTTDTHVESVEDEIKDDADATNAETDTAGDTDISTSETLADVSSTTEPDHVQTAEPEVAAATEAEGGGELGELGNTPTETDVDKMTVKELRAHAEAQGISLEGTTDKASIVGAIKAASAPAA